MRINIGCGQTPTKGWRNYDNSLSLRLARIPILPSILCKLNIIENSQYQFIRFARANQIEYVDGRKRLPIPDASVEVLYSSHMLEHLDRNEAARFLKEAVRVLRPGGIIRIAVPDLKKLVVQYCESGDADTFIEATYLCVSRPRSFAQRLRLLLVGARHHQWMYDGNSLCRLLMAHGFLRAEVLPAGQTKIHLHEPLDLWERASESIYVEAEKQNNSQDHSQVAHHDPMLGDRE
jgi:predicted SAM-dependent methyltransferase